MSDPDDGLESPRKGRSNAILTYETVAGIDKKLTEVSTKLDTVSHKLIEQDGTNRDLEVRIRAIEIALAAQSGSSTRGRDVWLFVWSGLISLASLCLMLLNYLKATH